MKKQVIFAITLLLILLCSIKGSSLAVANPIPYPATPSQEKPSLNIETPQNYSSYFNTNSIALNFSVVQPDSWGIDYDFFYHLGQITRIEVSLDGNLSSCLYNSTVIATNAPMCITPPLVNYSIMLNYLTLGMHQLNVTVLAYGFYTNPIYGTQNIPVPKNSFSLYAYPILVSNIVYFAVEQQKPSPSIMPSATEQMETPHTLPNPFVSIGIASVIVILAVASVALVYFKTYRNKLANWKVFYGLLVPSKSLPLKSTALSFEGCIEKIVLPILMVLPLKL